MSETVHLDPVRLAKAIADAERIARFWALLQRDREAAVAALSEEG